MRLLTLIVIAAALLWSGYWWVGATANKTAVESWFAQAHAEAGDISVTGFPNRFDTVLTDVAVRDPGGAWLWEAPDFQIYALSYQPNKVIASFPPSQRIEIAGQTLDIGSERLAASLHLNAEQALSLRESILEAVDLAVASDLGWTLGIESAQFSVREDPSEEAAPHSYEVDLRADAIRLPEPLVARIDAGRSLAETMGPVRLRMTPVFDAAWDRFAGQGKPPELTALDIERAAIGWGDLELEASGAIIVDSLGRADGSLEIEVSNWAEMLRLAEEAGAVSPDLAQTLERALGAMAATTGDAETLQFRLGFSRGRTRLGLIPIGPAPQLVYRQ